MQTFIVNERLWYLCFVRIIVAKCRYFLYLLIQSKGMTSYGKKSVNNTKTIYICTFVFNTRLDIVPAVLQRTGYKTNFFFNIIIVCVMIDLTRQRCTICTFELWYAQTRHKLTNAHVCTWTVKKIT